MGIYIYDECHFKKWWDDDYDKDGKKTTNEYESAKKGYEKGFVEALKINGHSVDVKGPNEQ